jgi:large subunit ribosomal protein L19e
VSPLFFAKFNYKLTSGKNIRKLYKDGLIMRRQVTMHSRYRVKLYHEAVRKGRHQGRGKRKGASEARMPSNILWMRRIRILRRLLKKYRDAKKINKNIYHKLYLASKGNQFKNKNVLIESIHKLKQEKIREADIEAQAEARRGKNHVQKEKRVARKAKQLGEVEQQIVADKQKPAGKVTTEKSEQKADAKRKAKIAEKKTTKTATKASAPAKPKAEKKPNDKAKK